MGHTHCVYVPSVKVGGILYDVRMTDCLRKDDMLGCAYHRDCYIEIDKTIPHQQKAATFIHEVLHCIDQVYGGGKTEQLSEGKIDSLAEGLWQVLQDWGLDFNWNE